MQSERTKFWQPLRWCVRRAIWQTRVSARIEIGGRNKNGAEFLPNLLSPPYSARFGKFAEIGGHLIAAILSHAKVKFKPLRISFIYFKFKVRGS